ncbi:MAG: phytoene/squalene synthase family protein [Hyphomonas sp.]
MIREGSKSFHAASLILPKDVRLAARSIYAFCRMADDRIDECRDPATGLRRLSERLAAVYAGYPEDSPVDRAFCWVVNAYAIPRAVPEGLLEGFAWDIEGRQYQTFEDLKSYATRVAGTVGVMMALVMGERRQAALSRAIDLGIAMQLTNIARDIGEDAAAGRCYIPEEWLRDARLDLSVLKEAESADGRIGELTRRMLSAAEPFYASGREGIGFLRRDCRGAIRAAADIYRDIGRCIAANGYDSIRFRAVVPKHRKVFLAANALVLRDPQPTDRMTEHAGLFLLQAVQAQPKRRRTAAAPLAGWPWVIDLFLRMEDETRLHSAADR